MSDMIALISKNLSTIIIGALVLGIIAFALVKTILNFRKGKSPCGCGCGCENCKTFSPPKSKPGCRDISR